MNVVVLLGPPGSGKSTHAKLLAKNIPSCSWMSMGDLLRDEIESGSEIGEQIQRTVANGELVPNDVCYKLLEPFFLSSLRDTFIIDGFPRSLNQVSILDDFCIKPIIIEINCTYEIVLDRLTRRCRDDDTETVIKHRYDVYTSDTTEAIKKMRKKYKVYKVYGGDDIDVIHEKIRKIIEENNEDI